MSQNGPEALTFRKYYHKLVDGFGKEEARWLANKLYSMSIITRQARFGIEWATAQDSSRSLMDALERAIDINPQAFHILLGILKAERAYSNLAQQMEATYKSKGAKKHLVRIDVGQIRIPGGETFTTNNPETLEGIQDTIFRKSGVPPEQQRLMFYPRKRKLCTESDESDGDDSGYEQGGGTQQHKSPLQVFKAMKYQGSLPPKIDILFIKGVDWKTYTVRSSEAQFQHGVSDLKDLSIKDLKRLIQKKTDIPTDQQRLMQGGKQLEETTRTFDWRVRQFTDSEQYIRDYESITNQSTIFLLMRVLGGRPDL